jgi:ribosomal protein S18 acetylase RimI-like enzyme
MNALSLKLLGPEHCRAVARLHLENLRTSFRGRPGIKLLMCYYDTLTNTEGACGYVAEKDKDVAGYICGVWDSEKVKAALLKRHRIKLLFWGALQVLIYPPVLLRLARRLTNSINTSENDDMLSHAGYELRPIVVAPNYRGTAVARQLVQKLIQDAAGRGFGQLFLYTETDNAAANAFYRKAGFIHVSTHHIKQKAAYLRYEILTSEVV